MNACGDWHRTLTGCGVEVLVSCYYSALSGATLAIMVRLHGKVMGVEREPLFFGGADCIASVLWCSEAGDL